MDVSSLPTVKIISDKYIALISNLEFETKQIVSTTKNNFASLI
jgi:hypothetical protein